MADTPTLHKHLTTLRQAYGRAGWTFDIYKTRDTPDTPGREVLRGRKDGRTVTGDNPGQVGRAIVEAVTARGVTGEPSENYAPGSFGRLMQQLADQEPESERLSPA